MPTWLLNERLRGATERMDDPRCDPNMLRATYQNFWVVNQLLSGWHALYRSLVRHELARGARTLLDIGAGGGDLACKLAGWAASDGFQLEVVGLDPDPRAIAYAQSRPHPPNVRFRLGHSDDLSSAGERFDIVLSNHLLHHLPDAEVAALCRSSEQLATHLVLHNDIRRDDLALAAFHLTWPLFPGSFITPDGLSSIRRSFTAAELAALAPPGWRVARRFPYRNVLWYRP